MYRLTCGLALSLVLAACGSTVKLDDTKVEDRSGASAGQSAQAGGGRSVNQGDVAKVDLGTGGKSLDMADIAARTVYFDYDSFVVKPEFQATIEAHAKYLKANGARKVSVEGHTDERGGREYNLSLGQARAEAVRRGLALLGVSGTQVEAVSYGKEKPAVQGTTEAAMEKNRRAEIVYR